jgi:cell division protein FtsZ
LDVTIDGAQGILFNVTGGPDMSLFEVNQAASIIRETAHPDANLIFGAVVDESMGDEIRSTVIATGFENRHPTRREFLQHHYGQGQSPRTAQAAPVTSTPAQSQVPAPAPAPVQRQPAERQQPVQPRFAPNNLDIPAFLRRR